MDRIRRRQKGGRCKYVLLAHHLIQPQYSIQAEAAGRSEMKVSTTLHGITSQKTAFSQLSCSRSSMSWALSLSHLKPAISYVNSLKYAEILQLVSVALRQRLSQPLGCDPNVGCEITVSESRNNYLRDDFISSFSPTPPPMAQQPLVGQGLLIIKASRSHSGTPHSVGSRYLTKHDTNKRQTSTPQAGLEPVIPASEKPQTQA